MPSAELTSIQAPHGPAAPPKTPCSPRLPTVAGGHRADLESLIYREAAGREAISRPPAERSRGRAAFRAIAWWLLRALTNSAGAWALAAGAPPPDPYN